MPSPPSWAQVATVSLAAIALFGVIFRILLVGWIARREAVEKELATGLRELTVTHMADIEGLRKSFFGEMEVMRELGHRRNNEVNVLMGRLSNQVENLFKMAAAIENEHKSLGVLVTALDKSVTLLNDRMSRRSTDRRPQSEDPT